MTKTETIKPTVAADLRPEIIKGYLAGKAAKQSNADIAANLGVTTNVLTRIGIAQKLKGDSLASELRAAATYEDDKGRERFAKLLATSRYKNLKSIPYLSVASGVSDGVVRTLLEGIAEPTSTPKDSRVGYAILAARRAAKPAKVTPAKVTPTKVAKDKGKKAKTVATKIVKGEVA